VRILCLTKILLSRLSDFLALSVKIHYKGYGKVTLLFNPQKIEYNRSTVGLTSKRRIIMLKKILHLSSCMLCLFVLSSCGARNYTVNLNPNAFRGSYLTNNEVSSIAPAIQFTRGTYIDKREDKEHFGTSRRYNILTDNEFSDAFYDGLEAFLTSSNQLWGDIEKSDIKVDVELLETQSELIQGFWLIRYMSRLSTKIKFIDLKTNKTIYEQTYNGYSDIKTPAGHESMFKLVVNKSIVDCINKIGMDKELYEALIKNKSKT